jgi:hypothetical protein
LNAKGECEQTAVSNEANDSCSTCSITQHDFEEGTSVTLRVPEPTAALSQQACTPSLFASQLQSIFRAMHGTSTLVRRAEECSIPQRSLQADESSDSQITAEPPASSKSTIASRLKTPSASKIDSDTSLDFFLRPLSDGFVPVVDSRIELSSEQENVSFSLPSSASLTRLLPDHYYCR